MKHSPLSFGSAVVLSISGLALLANCEAPEGDDEATAAVESVEAHLSAGDIVTLRAEHSGRCVTVLDGRTQDGANVGQASCTGAEHQQFRVVDRGQGRVSFQALHSNKCIAVRGGSGATSRGQNIEQQPCSTTDTTRMFLLTSVDQPSYLYNVGTRYCAEVTNGSTSEGANVRQWSCAAKAHQRFALEPVAPPPPPVEPPPGEDLPTGDFHIQLAYASTVSDAVQAAFDRAARRWETVIVGDLPNASGGGSCGSHALPSSIDDVVIFVQVAPMDGRGKILGSAGPCRVRSASQQYLPIAGTMTFDADDLQAMSATALEDVILHEMGHVLGIGTLWSLQGDLQLATKDHGVGADTHFRGPAAIEAFDELGGTAYAGNKVPVENEQGGAGTLDGHWRESVFVNELMTGFLNQGDNPMSAITIAALSDLGYETRLEAADPFQWPVTTFRSDAAAMPLGEELLPPIQIAEDDGSIGELAPR